MSGKNTQHKKHQDLNRKNRIRLEWKSMEQYGVWRQMKEPPEEERWPWMEFFSWAMIRVRGTNMHVKKQVSTYTLSSIVFCRIKEIQNDDGSRTKLCCQEGSGQWVQNIWKKTNTTCFNSKITTDVQNPVSYSSQFLCHTQNSQCTVSVANADWWSAASTRQMRASSIKDGPGPGRNWELFTSE